MRLFSTQKYLQEFLVAPQNTSKKELKNLRFVVYSPRESATVFYRREKEEQ